jgi:hypothetical protein
LLLEEQRYGKGITMAGAANTGRLGLTVTFLLGAIRNGRDTPECGRSKADLRALLADTMSEHQADAVVRIYECGTLHEPTACLSDGMAGGLGDAVTLRDGSPSKLYAWPQYFAGPSKDLDSLTRGLWNLLDAPLSAGKYSYRHGYKEFDTDDDAFIRRALGRHDDDE